MTLKVVSSHFISYPFVIFQTHFKIFLLLSVFCRSLVFVSFLQLILLLFFVVHFALMITLVV